MPRRSSGGSRSSSRPSPPPTAPRTSRPYTTSTAPPQSPASPHQRSSGLLGRFASTAAGVAVGSAIGHSLVSMFGGLVPRETHNQITEQTGETIEHTNSKNYVGSAVLFGTGGAAWWYRNKVLRETSFRDATRALRRARIAGVVAVGSGVLGLVNLVG